MVRQVILNYIPVIWLLDHERRECWFRLFVYLSGLSSHWGSACKFCLIFSEWRFQCHFNFLSICCAALHLSFARTSQALLWDLSNILNCSSVLTVFARLVWICPGHTQLRREPGTCICLDTDLGDPFLQLSMPQHFSRAFWVLEALFPGLLPGKTELLLEF